MKYIYYKDKKGNFGDDLNPWLWSKLFKNDNRDDNFLGIGTILYAENKLIKELDNKPKIVFGTGYRPNQKYVPFNIDSSWDIRFLRGPLSVYGLGNRHQYITDAAYAMRCLPNFEEYATIEKRHEISFMPYFRSVEYFDWPKICKILGYNYISPYAEKGIEHTISEIASSKHIISEAMHGAIIADILRVPWHRFILTTLYAEGAHVSEFKWMDWLMSINLPLEHISQVSFYRSGTPGRLIRSATGKVLKPEFLIKPLVKKQILDNLSQTKKYYLSDDKILCNIDARIAEEVRLINNM